MGISSTPSTRRMPGHGGLGLVEHLGELGDRLEEPVREEDEADQRAGGEPAGGPAEQARR